MPREGFKVDWAKRMSKKAVCAYFGNRGMTLSESEIVGHWVGTYTYRVYDYDIHGVRRDQIEEIPALAIAIRSKPTGSWQHADTDAGRADVYGLRDIYGELVDDVPRPRKRTVTR